MPHLLEVEDLSFQYPSYPGLPSAPLFESLSLAVGAGECVRVLGAPESGKSTLARIVSGLVPRYTGGVISGRVRVAGQDAIEARACELIETVGLAFQNPDEQIVTARCSSEVAFALESLGVEPAEMHDRVRAALQWAGLAEYAARVPLSLSGGEKRRLLLACLHAVGPTLWVLDETVEELDVAFRDVLFRTIRERGAACLLLACKEIALPAGSVDRTLRLQGRGLAKARRSGSRRARTGRTRAAARPAPRETVLHAQGLAYSFPGSGGAFRLDVPEIRIGAGEVVALTGPNGAGKSTLGRILCGLLEPSRGLIQLRRDGEMIEATGERRRSSVAYVFQNPDYQIFLPTVREELEYGLLEAGEDEAARIRRMAEAARRFDLPPLDAPVALVGYGARKRVQLATYYLLERRLVILDEADSGLGREEYVSAVRGFADRGVSVMAISHDHELAEAVAERLICMDRGVLRC